MRDECCVCGAMRCDAAVDMCEAIGCAAIITVNDQERPEDMADFVEYCWGDASTPWGSRRVADGHPHVYRVTRVEVGNEVPPLDGLCDNTVAIAAAMDERCAHGLRTDSHRERMNLQGDGETLVRERDVCCLERGERGEWGGVVGRRCAERG